MHDLVAPAKTSEEIADHWHTAYSELEKAAQDARLQWGLADVCTRRVTKQPM